MGVIILPGSKKRKGLGNRRLLLKDQNKMQIKLLPERGYTFPKKRIIKDSRNRTRSKPIISYNVNLRKLPKSNINTNFFQT